MENAPADQAGRYERDLDLNLLRVLVVVAEEGSVTRAASRLYLTQPAVSAALGRLRRTLGEPVVLRQGRQIVLSARGRALVAMAQPHLRALVDGFRAPPAFEAATAEHIFRLGLSDDLECAMLPTLLRQMAQAAPRVHVVVVPIQFRTVNAALLDQRVDLAVCVADEAPAAVERAVLGRGRFVCLMDGAVRKDLRKGPSRAQYLQSRHLIVSYNQDLRGIVEDSLGLRRDVVCSVPHFSNLGAMLRGSPWLATVSALVAQHLCAQHPGLRMAPLPFRLPGSPIEMLWLRQNTSEPAQTWLRSRVREAFGHGVAD
jgi:LysR family transcriptional activator of mexEF-oprN operon